MEKTAEITVKSAIPHLFFDNFLGKLLNVFALTAITILYTLAFIFWIYEDRTGTIMAASFGAICIALLMINYFHKSVFHYSVLFINVSLAIFYFSSYCSFYSGIYLYNLSLALAIACSFNYKIRKERALMLFHFAVILILFFTDFITQHRLFHSTEISESQINLQLTINIYFAFTTYILFVLILIHLNKNQYRLKNELINEGLKVNKLKLDNIKTKEILVAEIHHRVKNNLSLISSLIKFKLFGMDEKLNSKEETLHSIQTISLANHQFFLEGNSIVVNTHTYLDEVLNSWYEIPVSGPKTAKNISIRCENFNTTVSTAISVGLIVHEFFILFHETSPVQPSPFLLFQLSVTEEEILLTVSSSVKHLKSARKERAFMIDTLVEQLDGEIIRETEDIFSFKFVNEKKQPFIESERLF